MKHSKLVVPVLAVFFSGCAIAGGSGHDHAKDANMMKDSSHMSDGKAMKEQEHGHGSQNMTDAAHMGGGKPMNMAQGAAEMTDGEVKRISKGSKKLTIKHGEIHNMGMPPMTMVFGVSDEKMLDKLKKGDKVKFTVKEVDGQMVITEIKPQ